MLFTSDVETLARQEFFVTEDTLDDVLSRIESAPILVVDTETNGIRPWHGDRLCGIGVAFDKDSGYYLSFRHPEYNLPLSRLRDVWAALSKVPVLVGHNIKFDIAVMYQDGYDSPDEQRLVDVMSAARLCEAEKLGDLSLSGQLRKAFGPAASRYDEDFKGYLKANKWAKKFHLAPAPVVGNYCMGDVFNTWRLKARLEEQIKNTGQWGVWEEEQDMTYTLWRMERRGIKTDDKYATDTIPQLQATIENGKLEIYGMAGQVFNTNSVQQLNAVMKGLGVVSPKTTEKGNPSWDKEVLKKVDHPLTNKLLEIRGREKTLNTYFLPIFDWPEHTIHCTYRSAGTVTGRCSCADPNLQNISKKKHSLASEEEDYLGESNAISVKRLFVARPGYRLYMLDYEQMEMRVLADYLDNPALKIALEEDGFDFHTYTTELMFGISEDHPEFDHYRTIAKTLNFGLVYGMGIKKLANDMGMRIIEAKEYRQNYLDMIPGLYDFAEKVKQKIEIIGHIHNRFGRRYWIDAHRAYIGVNYLVQGTSADIVKRAMIACQQFIMENNLRSAMLLQVHDEIVFEIHESEEEWLPFKLREIMERRLIEAYLPVTVERAVGSWGLSDAFLDDQKVWESALV